MTSGTTDKGRRLCQRDGCGHPYVNHVTLRTSSLGLCTEAGCRCLAFLLMPGRLVVLAAEVYYFGPLCPPCSASWQAWLDYEMPPPPIQLITINPTPRELEWQRQHRADRYYDDIRWGQGLIVKGCAEGRHSRPKAAV